MQINLTGFLNSRNARTFMEELWELLISAMENIGGIPAKFLEQKKEEIKQRQVTFCCTVISGSVVPSDASSLMFLSINFSKQAEQERIQANLKKREEEIKQVLSQDKDNKRRRSAPFDSSLLINSFEKFVHVIVEPC